MALNLYNPFKNLTFEDNICFLSGVETTEKMTVFPEWLMDRFNLREDEFKLMDKVNSTIYKDLVVPASPEVKRAFKGLDIRVRAAFEKGYEGMSTLDSEVLFLWIGRIVYGILYNELTSERSRIDKFSKGGIKKSDREFGLSDYLRVRYGRFHLMLQSIISPIKFVGDYRPWSITVFRLKYNDDIFSYRDDAVNLLFQLGVKGFGLVATLADNGVIAETEKELLDQIKNQTLHPAQFEELFARFHYRDYILQYKPECDIEYNTKEVTVKAIPVIQNEKRPLYGQWDPEMFANLMANYLAVYGFEKDDFLPFQKPPISYLTNAYTGKLIDPASIDLPF